MLTQITEFVGVEAEFSEAACVSCPTPRSYGTAEIEVDRAVGIVRACDATRKGLVLPVTVTDAQHPNQLARWAVYVDGEQDEKVCGRVCDNTIVLDSRGGLVFTIR